MSIELVGKDAPRMLNKLAREEMKELVMRDILCDMASARSRDGTNSNISTTS